MALDGTDFLVIEEIKDEIRAQNRLIEAQNQILIELIEQLKYLR